MRSKSNGLAPRVNIGEFAIMREFPLHILGNLPSCQVNLRTTLLLCLFARLSEIPWKHHKLSPGKGYSGYYQDRVLPPYTGRYTEDAHKAAPDSQEATRSQEYCLTSFLVRLMYCGCMRCHHWGSQRVHSNIRHYFCNFL